MIYSASTAHVYKQRIDMAGLRYGRLVGLRFDHKGRSGHAFWRFACDCGGEVVTNGANVRRGDATSCGCWHREVSAARLTVHGHRAPSVTIRPIAPGRR